MYQSSDQVSGAHPQRISPMIITLHSTEIMHVMQQIHMLGIAPTDFAERNVLMNDNGQYMID